MYDVLHVDQELQSVFGVYVSIDLTISIIYVIQTLKMFGSPSLDSKLQIQHRQAFRHLHKHPI